MSITNLQSSRGFVKESVGYVIAISAHAQICLLNILTTPYDCCKGLFGSMCVDL